MKIKNLILLTVLVLFFLFLAEPALAICRGPIVPCGHSGNPCKFCHIFVLIANIVNYLLTCIIPIIAALMLIVGGFFLLISGPNPEQLNKAKGILTATVIGMFIIFLAWVSINTLLDFMEIKEWTGLGTWWDWTGKCPVN